MSIGATESTSDPLPLVSVLMNCFNGEKYLREAIDSVIAQTYTNWEIIFWDNQSTDGSATIVKSYSDPRIKYHYAPTHTLLYEARNYAFGEANGDLIAFLDVDDTWTPGKLKAQVPLFLDPKVGLSCSNYWIDDQLEGKRRLASKKSIPRSNALTGLLHYYNVGLLTLMVRRSALPDLQSPFNPRFHIIGDFDLVTQLAAKWHLSYLREAIAVYRIHGTNESITRKDRLISELESWVNARSTKESVAKACSHASLETYLNYTKANQAILLSRRLDAVSFINKMPWCYLKVKTLGALMLPNKLLQKLL